MEEQVNSGNSILDRILQSQQSDTLEHFNPQDIVNELLKQLSTKEADVLRRRFGLGTREIETLELIGETYHVTRERVRQIQRWAVQRLLKSPSTKTLLRGLDVVLQQLLEEHGGILEEEELFISLHRQVSDARGQRAATTFILEELLRDKVSRVAPKDHRPYWKLSFANTDLMETVIAEAEKLLAAGGQPLTRDQLFERLQTTEFWKSHQGQLTETVVFSYIGVAKTIEHNPFGEYGLRTWGSVVPKRMNDKILLVLRKHGKPMHFQEITKRINEIGFDQRQAYPPTVHNELILNKEYVLVGRGIYALKEWGYKPGVVADVLAAILKDAGRPMSRDELVAKVLEQRLVKKNTIHLALTNRKLFSRTADGLYTIAQSEPAAMAANTNA